jgi:glycosyltransferase involved in cell wall biosynthesis
VNGKSNLWLTIITVTKDDANGLARTLTSAAKLRAAGAEHVVIDGSDDAAASAKLAAEAGQGITHMLRPPRGVADAFNEGLECCHGEWVWFLNGGDAVHEALARDWLLSLLATTRADIVTGALHFDGESAPRPMPHLSYQWPLIACWLAHPTTLVRRKTLLSVGGFDQRWRIAMDYDLWFRLLGRDAIVDVVSVPFARFDVKGVSEHRETRVAARGEEAKVVQAHCGRLGGAAVRLCLRVVRRISWALWRSLPFGFGRKHETQR